MTEKPKRAAFLDQPLYALLRRRFPAYRTAQKVFDVPAFAQALNMSAEGVYKWLRADKLSSEGARSIVELSQKAPRPIKPVELATFVIR